MNVVNFDLSENTCETWIRFYSEDIGAHVWAMKREWKTFEADNSKNWPESFDL